MADEHGNDGLAPLMAADDGAALEAALRHAELEVAHLDPSSTERRLRQMLAVVRRAVGSWGGQPPSAGQLALLARVVEDVLREANRESPTERLRRPG